MLIGFGVLVHFKLVHINLLRCSCVYCCFGALVHLECMLVCVAALVHFFVWVHLHALSLCWFVSVCLCVFSFRCACVP